MAGEVHPSDAIVAVVGYYAGEVRRLQALLAVQAQGAQEMKRQHDETCRLLEKQIEQTHQLLREVEDVQRLLGAEADLRPGALLSLVRAKLRAASPP